MIEAYATTPERGQASQLTGWIYALVDPRDHSIFYVGQTRDLDTRKRTHFAGGHSVSGAMIKVIRSNGLLPLVVVLEADVALRRLGIAEAFWIALLRRRGCTLLNVPPQADARRQMQDAVRSRGFGAPRILPPCEPQIGNDLSLNEREQRRQQRVREQGLPLNTGKPWTSGEEAVLQALFRRGLRADDIARRFGRSRDAIAARLVRLGLVGMRDAMSEERPA
jgi:hypothetical protein